MVHFLQMNSPLHPGLRPVKVVPPRRTDGNIWENW